MRRVLNEKQVAARMSDFQDTLEAHWDAQCVREAYRVLKSWERREARVQIAAFSVGDRITFDSGRIREGSMSIRHGIIDAVHISRLTVRVEGERGKWRVPASLIIDHEVIE